MSGIRQRAKAGAGQTGASKRGKQWEATTSVAAPMPALSGSRTRTMSGNSAGSGPYGGATAAAAAASRSFEEDVPIVSNVVPLGPSLRPHSHVPAAAAASTAWSHAPSPSLSTGDGRLPLHQRQSQHPSASTAAFDRQGFYPPASQQQSLFAPETHPGKHPKRMSQNKAVELVHVVVPPSPESTPMRRRKTSATATSQSVKGAIGGRMTSHGDSVHYQSSSSSPYHQYFHQTQQSVYRAEPATPKDAVSGLGLFPTMRKSHAVPDTKYHAYVSGLYHPGGRNRGYQSRAETSLVDSICCANLCFGISIVATVFLVFVGLLFDLQPLYIKGILPKHIQYVDANNLQRTKLFYETNPKERLDIAKNAYQAAFCYFLTAVCCIAYTKNWIWYLKSRWNRYHDIPDAATVDSFDSTIPTFHSSNTPNSGNAGGDQQQAAYTYSMRTPSRIWSFGTYCVNRVQQMYRLSSSRAHARRKRGSSAKDV